MLKRVLSVFLIVFTLVPMAANFDLSAATVLYSGTNGGADISWTIDSDGLLTLKGTGDTYDFEGLAYAPWHMYRSEVKSVLVWHGITGIGKNCFVGLYNLTSVTLSSTVERIGHSAFNSCTALSSIVLPASVNYIGDSAFMYCTSLTSFAIPDAVTYIGDGAFSRCDNLQTLHIGAANPYYICEYGVLYNKNKTELIVCPAGTQLTSYTLPATATSMKANAFYGCANLQSITLSAGITAIPDYAFSFCTSLTDVDLDNITSIGLGIFSNATSIKDVKLPEVITKVPDFTFTHCDSIETVVLPDAITEIGYYAFSGCDILKSVELPESLTTLGTNAFQMCPMLECLELSDKVTSIDGNVLQESGDAYIKCSIFSYAYEYALSKSIPVVTYETIESISVNTMPDKTVYGLSAEKVDITGLTINLNLTDGTKKTLSDYFTVSNCDFSTGGDKTVTVYFGDFTTEFTIFVDETIIQYPESEHPYPTFVTNKWYFEYPTHADKLLVTFSEETLLDGYDHIEIDYFMGGTPYYRTNELAGKTIEVNGNYFTITMTSSGGEKTYGFSITNIEPVCTHNTVTVDGVDLTMSYTEDIKDIFIARGEYDNYTDVNKNKTVRLTETKLASLSEYTYMVPGGGNYTVLFRYNDGSMKFAYAAVDVTEPVFTENGLQLNVANLEGIKVIRTAAGEHKSAASIKRTDGARAFTAKGVLSDADNYTIQFREEGTVTVAVCYENGYTAYYTYYVTQKKPDVTQEGNKITFSKLDDLKVLRYAKGEYSTSGEIKRAEGSVALTSSKVVNGEITVSLKAGTYSFCVQYNDESYNYYIVTVE